MGTLNVDGAFLQAGQLHPGVGSTVTTGMRNRLMNGDMRIDQRNNGSLLNSSPFGQSSIYCVDRWMLKSSASACTMQQVDTSPPSFSKSLQIILASDGLVHLQQLIPVSVLADFNIGSVTGVAAPFCLSMWIMSSQAQIIAVSLHSYPAATAQYVTSFSITTASTWQPVSISFPACTIGSWSSIPGSVVIVTISFGKDDTSVSVPDVWNTDTEAYATPASINQHIPDGTIVNITGVQLELGTHTTYAPACSETVPEPSWTV